MITIKSDYEVSLMRKAGEIVGNTHKYLMQYIKPGITTKELNDLAKDFIIKSGATPSFQDLYGFPGAICISINEEVVHGIPSSKRILKDGDVVSLDAGVIYKGYHSDAARTHGIGEISKEAKKLIEVTRQSFFEGIKYAKEGNHLFDISNAIGTYAESFGYGVVRDLCGHGVGTKLHESPQIPNYVMNRRGVKLKAGMTLAIEPMINMGTWEVDWLDDEWTVVSRDRSVSAHYENTVLITDGEPRLLTLTESEERA